MNVVSLRLKIAWRVVLQKDREKRALPSNGRPGGYRDCPYGKRKRRGEI